MKEDNEIEKIAKKSVSLEHRCKIFNKILANWIQKCIKSIPHNWDLSWEYKFGSKFKNQQYASLYQQTFKEDHMIISIDERKAFDKM